MKKPALLFKSQITHQAGHDLPRVVGTAPKNGLVPTLVAALLFLALVLYILSEAVSR